MNVLAKLILATVALSAVTASWAHAEVALPPFYAAASALRPEGKLGQVLKKERVNTRIPGATAWRIAYVSSDVLGRKTLSTALAPFDVSVMVPPGPLDGPAAEKVVGELLASFSAGASSFTHFAMTVWANQAAFPGLLLTDVFTDDGARVVDAVVSKKCMHAAAATLGHA